VASGKPGTGVNAMINIQYYQPAKHLQSLIGTYYSYEATLSDEQIVHDRLLSELAGISFLLSGNWTAQAGKSAFIPTYPALVSGPSSTPINLTASGTVRVFGISILPLGWVKLFDRPADTLANKMCSLAEVVGNGADHWAISMRNATSQRAMNIIADTFLTELLAKKGPDQDHKLIEAIDARLRSRPITRVGDLATLVNLSVRQLERVMPKAYGFSPKTVLRRQRYLRAIQERMGAPDPSWLNETAEDFYDQSHMIREFLHFAGESPKAFFMRGIRILDETAQMLTESPFFNRPKPALTEASIFVECRPAPMQFQMSA
jgi:AraC-like DNA-binding protein